jgi:hypothetical protein
MESDYSDDDSEYGEDEAEGIAATVLEDCQHRE